MSSDRQIEANRWNSQLPTRPRTPEGKPSSRLNALKSGIDVKTQLIPGEDRAELEAMKLERHQLYRTLPGRFTRPRRVAPSALLPRRSRTLAPPSAPELASFCPPSPSPSINDLLSSGHEFLGMDRVICFATDRLQHPDLPHYFNPGRKSGGRADTGFVRGSRRPGDRADQIRARR